MMDEAPSAVRPANTPKMRRALRPDAQAFDKVTIETRPRYKTSGLSGDEWRISAVLRFYRKGKLVHETTYRDIQTACIFAAAEYFRAVDDAKGYFAGVDNICDQEGCAELSTHTYRMKEEYCRQGHKSDPYEFDKTPLVRKFCDEHKTRGDCGLDDADDNYDSLEEWI